MCLAIPGRIEAITDPAAGTRRGRVDFGGVVKEIVLPFVPEAGEGDWILAHVGFAIARNVASSSTSRFVELILQEEEYAHFIVKAPGSMRTSLGSGSAMARSRCGGGLLRS